jgi:hypothetical protein
MSTPRRLAPRSIGTPVIRMRVRLPPGNERDGRHGYFRTAAEVAGPDYTVSAPVRVSPGSRRRVDPVALDGG